MTEQTVLAPAKLNLTLDILGIRPDGYHELDMLMQAVSLCDEVTVALGTGAPWRLTCEGAAGAPLPEIPCDERNLAWRAAASFFQRTGRTDGGVRIHIRKRIPAQAGMAGGSADAAAVLRALNALCGTPLPMAELCELAGQSGSDTPFCTLGGTARARGRGERLMPVTLTRVQHYVICKPPFGISTPQLFALSDRDPITRRPEPEALVRSLNDGELKQAGRLLCNVLEPVAAREHPQLLTIRDRLLQAGACGAQMTGSGSAVFGLFPGVQEAKRACAALMGQEFAVFYAHSV